MQSKEDIKQINALMPKETAIDDSLREYPKDSFDRFGDDLCELIVSHLSIECKLRFECVSKQWKRLLANRQKKLIISIRDRLPNGKRIAFQDMNRIIVSTKGVEYIHIILKKFRFITHLEVSGIKPELVLNEVIDNCHQLTSFRFGVVLYYGFDNLIKTFEKFGEKFRQTLREFSIEDISLFEFNIKEVLINILSKFKNLTKIQLKSDTYFNINDSLVQRVIENSVKLSEISISYELNDMKVIEVLNERANSNPKIEYKFEFSVKSMDEYLAKEKSLKIANNLELTASERRTHSDNSSDDSEDYLDYNPYIYFDSYPSYDCDCERYDKHKHCYCSERCDCFNG